MPHGIEYIVRPFAAPDSLGNRVIPATPRRTTETAHITWGGVGMMPKVKVVNPETVVNAKWEELNEQGRNNETVRIVGNDGESYVDVARPDEVRLKGAYFDSSSGLAKVFYTSTFRADPRLDPYLKNFVQHEGQVTVENGDVKWKFINE